MSSTCFEPKGSSTGRWLTMQLWYGMIYKRRYKQSSRKKSVFTILFYLLDNCHPEDKPSGLKHVGLKIKTLI